MDHALRKKPEDRNGSNEPQFETVADAAAYYREKLALTEKAVTEKDKTIEKQAKTIEKQAKTISKRDATIEKQNKTTEKQIGTIAALKEKNKAQASAMKKMATKIKNLEAAMRRQEEIIKKQTLENKRTRKALGVALHDLNIECSAHRPTSQQMVRDLKIFRRNCGIFLSKSVLKSKAIYFSKTDGSCIEEKTRGQERQQRATVRNRGRCRRILQGKACANREGRD